LHPRPPALRVVQTTTDDPHAALQAVAKTGAEPVAAEWDGTTLTTLFESSESAAEQQAQLAVDAVGGEMAAAPPPGFGTRPWETSAVGLKVTHRLGATREAIGAVRHLVPAARVRAQIGSGVVLAGVDVTDLAALGRLRDAIAAHDGQVVVASAADDVKREVDVWGPVRGLAVMQRIKQQFDPDRLMCPGRFVVSDSR
jgi:glycolate oxidase FAD binding subunit